MRSEPVSICFTPQATTSGNGCLGERARNIRTTQDSSEAETQDVAARRAVTRTRRSERNPSAARLQMTPRDEAILRAVGEMKFARADQIGRLFFNRHCSTVRNRLRRLVDAGLIKAWVTALAEPNLYSLTSRGLAALAVGEPEDAPLCVPRRLDGKVRHLGAINDFRVNLALALERARDGRLRWRSEWQYRGSGKLCLIPDALFLLPIGTRAVSFALEMDLGGEPAQKVFAAKIRKYAAFGERPDFILVVTTYTRRLLALVDAAGHEPGGADFLFTVRSATNPDGILGNIWTSPRLLTAQGATFRSLLDLSKEKEITRDE
jgi:Replication-relaxation